MEIEVPQAAAIESAQEEVSYLAMETSLALEKELQKADYVNGHDHKFKQGYLLGVVAARISKDGVS